MCKKLFCLTVVVLVSAMVGNVWAASWTAGGADDLWSNSANWYGDLIPVSGEKAKLNIDGAHALIDSTVTAECGIIELAVTDPRTCYIDIDGGSLTALGKVYVGFGSAYGGDAAHGVLTVSNDGQMTTDNELHVGYYGRAAIGTIDMSSGTISSLGYYVGFKNASGYVNLDGGTMSGGWLLMGGGDGSIPSTRLIDITEGVMIIGGGTVNYNRIMTYVTNDWIIGYSGTGTVVVEYDAGASTTTVSAVPEPATMIMLSIGGLLLRRRK